MSQNLQLQVTLSTIDKLTTPFRNASKEVNKLSTALKSSKEQLKALEKSQSKMSSFSRTTEKINKSTEAISKHTKKLEDLRRKSEKMKAERSNLKGDINRQQTYVQQLLSTGDIQSATTARFHLADMVKKYDQLNEKIKSHSKILTIQKNTLSASRSEKARQLLQLRELKRKLKESGINVKEFSNHEINLAGKIKLANDEIAKQEQRLKKLNAIQARKQAYRDKVEKLKSGSQRLQHLGQRALISGATISAPISNSVRDFMTFEDAMVGVARQVPGLKDEQGKFTAEYDVFVKKIKQAATELPMTTEEIANMVTAAARMEVPKDELIDFVRISTQMATAFDAENPEELAEQFGKVAKNFKLSSKEGKELADVINYLDDNAISKGTSIIGFMNRVSGVAGIAKITDKNMAALGSTLQTLGAGEEDSATAVNAIFTRLASAGKKKPVKNGLAVLGISPKAIEKGMVTDAQGTLMKIIDAVNKLPEAKRLGVIADLVGTEHSKTLAKLVSNTQEWKRQIELANNQDALGSMEREFQTRMTALSSKWQLFKNRLFNVNSSIGASLKKSIEQVMDSISTALDKVQSWIDANPELTASILKWTAAIGGSLTVIGGLSMALSFLFYPISRLILGFSYFTNLGDLVGSPITKLTGKFINLGKVFTTWKGLGTGIFSLFKMLGRSIIALWNPMNYLRTGWKMLLTLGRGLLLVFRLFTVTPIGLLITALVTGAMLIYKYWDQVKAFFGGFWEGLKSGLAPVLEKFKPLGDLFGIVVGWLKSAVKWFTDLFNPVQTTQKELESAANAGRKFGEWTANAIELALLPLTTLMDGIKWVLDNLPGFEKGIKLNQQAEQIKLQEEQKIIKSGSSSERATEALSDINLYSSGGYVGNGGKYQPKGIVHGGEYVMTKEATSRLGIGLLNSLNYGKNALLATGLGVSVATAQPINIDYRPPITGQHKSVQMNQPMQVTININGSNQSATDIAREVQKELARLENQRQARQRSSLRDRD